MAGGVEVGDPPIYQDEHQAYVNFLFNKTTAFLDRTERSVACACFCRLRKLWDKVAERRA
jgi:hypothetical protein